MENTTPSPAEQWVVVGAAARATGLPSRTVYRWIESGTLRSKTDGKRKLVDLTEVQRLAAQRPGVAVNGQATAVSATVMPAVAGTLPASRYGGTLAPQPDGELSARLFGHFDDNRTPGEVVKLERLPSSLVMGVFDEWKRAKDAGGPGEPDPQRWRSSFEPSWPTCVRAWATASRWPMAHRSRRTT